jgi:hypothetical protein
MIVHLPEIAWRTLVVNVVKLPDNEYRINASPIDTNEPGAVTRAIGNYFKDNIGHTYLITDSDSTTITVFDSFGVGVGPQTGKQGIVYKSAYKGNSPVLAPIYYRHLDKSAVDYSRRLELSILWQNDPNPKRVEFEDTQTPKLIDYQTNYAEDYGELPKVQLITYDSAGVEWVRQEVPIWYRTDGLLTSIEWDLSQEYSGYIILSR